MLGDGRAACLYEREADSLPYKIPVYEFDAAQCQQQKWCGRHQKLYRALPELAGRMARPESLRVAGSECAK